jgi:proline iminopeptidase/L-proline amide hydrolase
MFSLAQEPLHIQRSDAQFAADPTAYHVLWGANELAVNGLLAQWDITRSLHKIRCPGLVLHGEYDQATSQVVQPLITHITHCRGVTIPDSSHNPHEENTEPCLTAVREFLRGLD